MSKKEKSFKHFRAVRRSFYADFYFQSTRKILVGDQESFFNKVFVELSMAHLLKKELRFYHLTNPRYIQNKKILPIIFNTL
jgi:hypothetical protein